MQQYEGSKGRSIMKTFFRLVLYKLLSVLNAFIPKNEKIVIYGGDFLDDNSEAMFRYLNDHTDYQVVCICNRSLNYRLRGDNRLVKDTYWNAFRELATAKVTIDSSFHTVKLKPTKTQLFIQCWHGSPLKSMIDPAGNGKFYSKCFYASDYFKKYMSSYFHADESRMICLGAPRNDYLFSPEAFAYTCSDFAKFKYRVIWMPTFRRGVGRIESSIDIPVLNSDNIKALDEKLQSLNIALIIKPHRVQAGSFEYLFAKEQTTNISIVTEEYFIRNNIPVYTFLAHMDALITDYSSVYFDYLLLDRPIGFAIDDFDQYYKNRGFAYDNPLEMMPGKKIYTFEDLVSFFEGFANMKDDFSEKRKSKADLFNKYKDKNCERLTEVIDRFLGATK